MWLLKMELKTWGIAVIWRNFWEASARSWSSEHFRTPLPSKLVPVMFFFYFVKTQEGNSRFSHDHHSFNHPNLPRPSQFHRFARKHGNLKIINLMLKNKKQLHCLTNSGTHLKHIHHWRSWSSIGWTIHTYLKPWTIQNCLMSNDTFQKLC